MRKNSKFRTIIAFVTALCFAFNTYASSNSVVNSLYNYAHNKQVTKIRYMVNNLGYSVDTKDDDGNTAWCIAKENNDSCALGVLERMGANPKQKCGSSWGVYGAVAGLAIIGGVAAAAGGGGGGGGSSDSCANVNCGANSHCEKGSCVCDEGFLDTEGDGVCYADLGCKNQPNSIGKQFKDACVCKQGYDGTLCNECAPGYDKYNTGECHLSKLCQNGGHQEGQDCMCINGWEGDLCQTCNGFKGDDGVCYETLACEHGGTQYRNTCDCTTAAGWEGDLCQTCNGFKGDDGNCYEILNCLHGGTQLNGMCDCTEASGWSGDRCQTCNGFSADNGVCYGLLSCEHGGKQYRDTCDCTTANGWEGDLCETCNNFEGSDGGCYEVLTCEHGGEQSNDTCDCTNANGWTGDLCQTCNGVEGADGGCYGALTCLHGGEQVNGTCDCTNANGWTGEFCETCTGFKGADGGCYEVLTCEHGGEQSNDTCDCTTANGWTGEFCETCNNFEGADGGCYEVLACEHGGEQSNNTCDCTNANGWEGDLCQTCNNFEGADGGCYEVLTCQHGGQQSNDTCDCTTANGWTGDLCEICNGFKGADGSCYEVLDCQNGGSQENDTCKCINGWEGDLCQTCNGVEGNDGVCYPDKGCQNGAEQVNNTCVCVDPWEGDVCDVCGGVTGTDGTSCYEDKGCQNGGIQTNDTCGCINNWTGNLCEICNGVEGDDGVCYPDKGCQNGGAQENDTCKCINGWEGDLCETCNGVEGDDGVCYPDKGCQNGGSQENDTCVCVGLWDGEFCETCTGTLGTDGTSCYETLACENGGSQVNDTCDCINNWEGDLCEICNGHAGVDGVCYPELNCGLNGHQENNICVCDEGYNRDSTGACVLISNNDIIAGSNDEKANFLSKVNVSGEMNVSSNIEWENYTNDNFFGKRYDDDVDAPEGQIIGDQYNLYLAYALNNLPTNTDLTQNLNVTLNNYGDGNVYGLSSMTNAGVNNVIVSYLQLDKNFVGDKDKQQNISLIVNNGGEMRDSGGNIMYPGENMVTGGNGITVGVYSPYSNLYNMVEFVADGVTNNVERSSLIQVKSIGSGTTVGMATEDSNINNGLFSVESYDEANGVYVGTNVVTDKAKVDVENTGSGEVFGLYSAGSGEIVNSGVVEVEANEGNAGGAISLYGSVKNSGAVSVTSNHGDVFGLATTKDVQNNGDVYVASENGDTVGLLSESNNVLNNVSGYVDSYSVNGDAYGIKAGITLDNRGDIEVVSEEAKAYAIYGGRNVMNTSTAIYAYGEDGAYGMYLFDNQTALNDGLIEAVADGDDGESYGVYAEFGVNGTITNALDATIYSEALFNAYGMSLVDTSVVNNGVIHAASTNSAALGINSSSDSHSDYTIENNGTIEAYSDESVSFGIWSENGTITNNVDATISASSTIGDAHGIYSDYTDIVNSGTIQAESEQLGAFGILAYESTITNNTGGAISASSTDNEAFGIYADNSTITNDGVINATGNDNNAYGIYGINSTITNNNTINVSTVNGDAYGIYADGSDVINHGQIVVSSENGAAYGIYANGGTVTNYHVISIIGDTSCIGDKCSLGSNHIVLENGAEYINSGVTSYAMSLNLDSFGGTTLLGKNGVFEATSISGTLGVDTSVVAEGFEDTYVEQAALKSEDVDVDVYSKSAMFEASVEKDTEESSSVVMNRKSFEELSASSSIAKFLEQNYRQQNNSILFSELKKADTLSYDFTEAQALGYALLPNFARENMSVFRNLNATLNDELFKATGVERKMVGYDHLYQSRDDKGTLTGYENYANTMYFMYDVEGDDLIRRGLGMSITQFRSDYEDDSNRKEIMAQVLVPVSYVDENGFSFASVARFGYADGEYERQALNNKFEADLTSWIYGLSNAVRYNIDLGFMTFEPTAEFNVIGYYQDTIKENENKANSLRIDAQNNLSVEAGLGFNLRKDVELGLNSKLSFKASAMYYHEFAKPFNKLDASVNGMNNSYKIDDYEDVYKRDRGVLSGQVDYTYKPFTFYGKFKQFIEDENPFEVNAGIKYNF